MEFKDLQQAGLSKKESIVYTSLLELKESPVSKIAKKTSINRSLLYFILSALENKGFVSYIIKNNVKIYRPIEPEKILNILKEKEEKFKMILPGLISLHEINTSKPIIEILEGKEGIKTIFNEILRLKKDWHAFNVPGKGIDVMGISAEQFEVQRQKRKIKLKVLCLNTGLGRKRGREFSKMKYTQVKYMKEEFDSPASNYIYGDRIAIIFWYENFPFAVRIIDKGLAESYKNYFNALWKKAKP